jgi:response regulator NasT
MVTAFAEREIVQQASEAGAFGYLLKPFRQDDVLAAITTAQARSVELADARAEAKSLTEALETRRVVERAKGMLMQTESISEGDAYARMRSASQRTGQPMRAIAEALLATLSGAG